MSILNGKSVRNINKPPIKINCFATCFIRLCYKLLQKQFLCFQKHKILAIVLIFPQVSPHLFISIYTKHSLRFQFLRLINS